jgi:hypothetical protein
MRFLEPAPRYERGNLRQIPSVILDPYATVGWRHGQQVFHVLRSIRICNSPDKTSCSLVRLSAITPDFHLSSRQYGLGNARHHRLAIL